MAFKTEHRKFIELMVKNGGDHIAASMTVFKVADRKSAATMGRRLLKNAEIAAEIKRRTDKIQNLATQGAAQELKKEIKGQVLTYSRKLQILADIAEKRTKFEKVIIINGKIKRVKVFPSDHSIMAAMKIDNAMQGHNATEEKHVTGDTAPTVIVQKLDDTQFRSLLKAVNDQTSAG